MKEVKLEVDPNLSAAENRQMLAARLSDVMTDLVFETSNYRRTLFDSLIDAAKTHGFNHKVSEDVNFKALNYRQLITKSFALGSAIAKVSKPKELLGVLMPNANSNAVLFFALQSHLRIPVMMNYSTGIANLISSAKTSKMKTIISSRRFIELAKLEEAVSALLKSGFNVVYLEDFAVNNITIFDKLKGLVAGFFPKHAYNLVNGKGNIDHKQACAVLFTSGSSGAPKGVMLSHENIQANRFQMSSKIDFSKNDIIFNALPMFHSFGLTAGTILPILSGVKVFFYPSPLPYKVIPEIVYSINATILFATNTFLNGYARFAHNYDFYSLRYVFAGAEKVYEETRSIWAEKFGIRILEGYGATETSPILSVNTAMEYKKGSVGRILPGITTILEEIEGINDGKKLIVKGPNVMLGYLLAEQPGKLQEVDNATYDTGDIVDIDDEGYIFIKGRAKRFAKIAGEMVSLGAIEVALQKLWPDFDSAVTTLPDSKKGEQIILVTTNKKGEKSEIVKYFKENNLPDIATPKTILVVDKLPLLGTGKIDYVGLNEVAKADI